MSLSNTCSGCGRLMKTVEAQHVQADKDKTALENRRLAVKRLQDEITGHKREIQATQKQVDNQSNTIKDKNQLIVDLEEQNRIFRSYIKMLERKDTG